MRKIGFLLVIFITLLCIFSDVIGKNSVLDNCIGKNRSEIKRLYPDFSCPESEKICSLFDGYFSEVPDAPFFVSLEFTTGYYSYAEQVYVFIPGHLLSGAGFPKTAEGASAIAEIILGDEDYYTLGFGDPDEIYMIYPKTNIGCQVEDGWKGYDVFCKKPYTLFEKLKDSN